MIWTQMVVVVVKFLTATRARNTFLLQERKNFFSIIIHMSMLHESSVRDYWSLQFLFKYLRIGSSHYWQCYNWIMMMHSQLGDGQAMTHNSKFGQLLTHHKISGHLHIRRTTDYWWGNRSISRAYILSCLYWRKAPQILDKNVWTLSGKNRLSTT
jgi:hypothetical protein